MLTKKSPPQSNKLKPAPELGCTLWHKIFHTYSVNFTSPLITWSSQQQWLPIGMPIFTSSLTAKHFAGGSPLTIISRTVEIKLLCQDALHGCKRLWSNKEYTLIYLFCFYLYVGCLSLILCGSSLLWSDLWKTLKGWHGGSKAGWKPRVFAKLTKQTNRRENSKPSQVKYQSTFVCFVSLNLLYDSFVTNGCG